MIGGTDVFVDGKVDRSDVDLVVRFFRSAWPDAIVSSPSESIEERLQTYRCQSSPWVSELFIYENQRIRELWRDEGLTDEGASAMVFATFEDDGISFVVDAEDSPSGQLVSDLRATLEWNRRTRVATEAPDTERAA